MKSLSTLLTILFTFSFLSLSARSEIIVESHCGETFILHVNGKCFNSSPRSRVKATDLRGSNHCVNLTLGHRNGPKVGWDHVRVPDGYSYTFSLKKRYGDYVLELVHESPLHWQEGPVCERPTPQYDPYSEYGNSCYMPMSNGEFHSLISQIERQRFSDDKERVAKRMIKSNCLGSYQIKAILDLFRFDDDKLRVAKFAWNYVVDPQSYYIVFDSFRFSSDQEKLERYMDSNPRYSQRNRYDREYEYQKREYRKPYGQYNRHNRQYNRYNYGGSPYGHR